MTRSEILTEVEAMIFARLFGRGRWLADRETAAILGRKLETHQRLRSQVQALEAKAKQTPFRKSVNTRIFAFHVA